MRKVGWSTILIVVMIVSLLVVEHVVVPAAAGRVLMEKPGDEGAAVTSVEKMKSTVESWFQRLASGPSPRGRGH
ncbi:PAMP-induced secreted peptide 1 [Hirschfeldia incana]|nr:PAMP-induced secreted peptide 1 [Hirschfeldia incana]